MLVALLVVSCVALIWAIYNFRKNAKDEKFVLESFENIRIKIKNQEQIFNSELRFMNENIVKLEQSFNEQITNESAFRKNALESFSKTLEKQFQDLTRSIKRHEEIRQNETQLLKREIFEIKNPIESKTAFHNDSGNFHVLVTNNGFRINQDGKYEDLDRQKFYDLWFSGQIIKS